MNSHRISTFIILFLLVIPFINGQEPEIVEPSINAQQFLNVRTATEDLHTGQITTSIPLFNLESRGIKLPISLSFTGIGFIKPESLVASNIGLGWSLLAGGVISHTVRGVKDSYSNYREWKYSSTYLESKVQEEEYDSYDTNLFDVAMDNVVSADSQPDEFNYSFNGYSGKIVFKVDNTNTYTGTLFPHITFKIENLGWNNGYKITTDDGFVYYFEVFSNIDCGFSSSWFLSKIQSPQGGEITLEYELDAYTKNMYLSPCAAIRSYSSQRIKKINFDKGYVLFNSSSRNDTGWGDPATKAKRIVSIELYDNNNQLIKGFELGNDNYFESNGKLKLNSIKSYDKNHNYLPPYTFEYESVLSLGWSCPYPDDPVQTCGMYSWAGTPGPIAIADRRMTPDLESIEWVEDSTYIQPQNSLVSFGHNRHSLVIKKVNFPTGGYEFYEYEDHHYSTFGSNTTYSYQGIGAPKIQGRRIAKKETVDGFGNSKVVEYYYYMHDENYERIIESSKIKSSGVLVNPSIRIATMYRPIYNDYSNNWIAYPNGNHERNRLVAIPHAYHSVPQNKLGQFPIYYKEVEEVFTTSTGADNGKNIYYFKEEVAVPAKNFVYLSYDQNGAANTLIEIPNNLYGNNDPALFLNNHTFLAYPVGDFYEYDYLKGTVLKQVTLNSDGDIVKKIENEYSSPYIEKQYGLIVHKFVDDPSVVNAFVSYADQGSGTGQTVRFLNRYLISRYTKPFSYIRLDQETVTDYFPASEKSFIQEISYNYTSDNYLRSKEIENSDGKIKIDYYHYPKDYSSSGDNIAALKANNIISNPIDVRSYNGAKLISGTQTKYNVNGQPEGLFVAELSGTDIPKDAAAPYTFPERATYTYNNDLISQINPKDSYSSVYLWDATGNYVMAKIENTTHSAVNSLNGKVSNYDSETLYDELKILVDDNALITTYTYKQLVGITQKTDTRGYTMYYEYDALNRLKRVKDSEGKVLSENQYHYKGQQ